MLISPLRGANRRHTCHWAGCDCTTGHYSRRESDLRLLCRHSASSRGAETDTAEQRLRDELLAERDHNRAEIDAIRCDVVQLRGNMNDAHGIQNMLEEVLEVLARRQLPILRVGLFGPLGPTFRSQVNLRGLNPSRKATEHDTICLKVHILMTPPKPLPAESSATNGGLCNKLLLYKALQMLHRNNMLMSMRMKKQRSSCFPPRVWRSVLLIGRFRAVVVHFPPRRTHNARFARAVDYRAYGILMTGTAQGGALVEPSEEH